MNEKEVQQGIHDIIFGLVEGFLYKTRGRGVKDLNTAIEHAAKYHNGFSREKYLHMHHPVHWYLAGHDGIKLIEQVPDRKCLPAPQWWQQRDQPGGWSVWKRWLPTKKQKIEDITNAIIDKYDVLLKCRYAGVHTMEDYHKKVKPTPTILYPISETPQLRSA